MEALLLLLDLSYKLNNGNNFFLAEHVVNCVNAGRQRVLRDVIEKNVKNPTRIFTLLQH